MAEAAGAEMKHWHELNTGAQRAVKMSRMTVGQFIKKYSQPDWCKYPAALRGGMGCWSLMIPGRIRKIEDCGGCDLKRELVVKK